MIKVDKWNLALCSGVTVLLVLASDYHWYGYLAVLVWGIISGIKWPIMPIVRTRRSLASKPD